MGKRTRKPAVDDTLPKDIEAKIPKGAYSAGDLVCYYVLRESTPENPKLVRLVMRQDSTLPVILNTVMLAGTDFQCKEGMKTVSVLFTARGQRTKSSGWSGSRRLPLRSAAWATALH